MDYESERLDAYDASEAMRFVTGAIKREDPIEEDSKVTGLFDLDLINQQATALADSLVDTGTKVVLGGARDAGQAALLGARDLVESRAERYVDLGLLDQPDNPMELQVPTPRLPTVEEPEGMLATLARDFVQFGTGFFFTPNKFGKLNGVIRSGIADAAYFDPAEGGFIRPLIEYGVLPEAIEFLAVDDINEETRAAQRLRERAKLAGEGAGAGAGISLLIAGLGAIKRNPKLMRYAAASLATGLGATIPNQAEAGAIKTFLKSLTDKEIGLIRQQATKRGKVDEELAKNVEAEAVRIKGLYPEEDGWLPININPEGDAPTFKVKKGGKIEIKWEKPAYAFHLPEKYQGTKNRPSPEETAAQKTKISTRMLSDVNDVIDRAQAGDQAAIDIINQANWYRSMRTRLRREFGGLADVFADIIGATSAQTNVQQNYENALQVLRRFVRGEFDAEIDQYAKLVERGEPTGTALFGRDADPTDEFRLIRKASGELFNTNSAAATEALLDMFRQVKKDKAPKTINFTGNLIGFGNEATIDVWAARYLRDAAGLPRIPPPAEKAVAGKHLTKSTLEEPRIGSEFGFGQKVFADVAAELNQQGRIKELNPDIGDLGPDDLQAVIWFLEKEKWAKNNWTTKAGEGGSLDYESVFGGSPDRARAAELRSIINSVNSKPEDIAEAQKELATLQGEPQRFVAGISRERPGAVPSNIQQNELAQEVLAPVIKDDKVIGVQANPSLGGFAGDQERNLNYEVVTQTDFDPTDMTRGIVEAGRKYDQDAVFVSQVVPDGTPGARPGVEVYFRDRQGVKFAEEVLKILQERGVDGYTFVTDARQADRASVQALGDELTSGLTGIRFQYIAEFDPDFDATRAQDIFDEKAELFGEVINDIGEIDGITYADVVHYKTTVYVNRGRSGTEWINGGTSYEEYFGGSVGKGAKKVARQGDLFGEAAPQANRSQKVRPN
tara:strand:+ start:6816 stop:9683 length:2868 start_codon:yes stop_codon:yes gene_type:complete